MMSDQDSCVARNVGLGYYDFRAFTILLAEHDDPKTLAMTSYHEYLHHYLTTTTKFGQLMSALVDNIDAAPRKDSSHTIKAVYSHCEQTHEMLATYASIILYAQTGLLPELPDLYKKVFTRGAALTEHVFDAPLARMRYLMAIAKCAMMTEPPETSKEFIARVISDGDASLRPENSPDLRLEQIENALLQLPPQTVLDKLSEHIWFNAPLVLECGSEAELIERLDGDKRLAYEALGTFSSGLMDTLCDLLESVLPGLTDSYSDYLITSIAKRTMVASHFDMDKWCSDFDHLEILRHWAQQKVIFEEPPALRRNIASNNPPMLRQIGHHSYEKTRCLYLYIQYPQEAAAIDCFLTDVEHDTPPGTLHCYRLTSNESIALRHWDGPLVSLIDQDDFYRLDGVPLSRPVFDALQTDCFVHIATNPVEFLMQLMSSGRSIKWTNATIYYNNDLVRREQGLSVTFYKLDDMPFTFFHLSNPSLTGVIFSFEDEVLKDRTRMRFYHIDEAQHEFSKQKIALFIDHPVFSYYLLHGEEIPALTST